MKALKYFSMMSLLLMSVFTFVACGDDDDDGSGNLTAEERALVGTWESVSEWDTYKEVITMTLYANHTGTWSFKYYENGREDKSEAENAKLTWSAAGGYLYITYVDGNLDLDEDEKTEIIEYTLQDGVLNTTGGEEEEANFYKK